MESTLTEERNPLTRDIDTLPTLDMLTLINNEDQKVALAVREELPKIAIAVDAITARMQRGGRLIYIGAGTSGRLGVLDASECPPTFGTPPELVVGLIAGGPAALTEAIEGAEDDRDGGEQEVSGATEETSSDGDQQGRQSGDQDPGTSLGREAGCGHVHGSLTFPAAAFLTVAGPPPSGILGS